MSEFEIMIPIEGSAYNECIIINKRGDQYSLILGYQGKGAQTTVMKWCYPQRDKQPAEKAVPWKILLGNRNEAQELIKKIAQAFGLKAVEGG